MQEREKSAYRAMVGRPEGRRLVGKPKHQWRDNIKMGLREIG
jgi:hypothetical protein